MIIKFIKFNTSVLLVQKIGQRKKGIFSGKRKLLNPNWSISLNDAEFMAKPKKPYR